MQLRDWRSARGLSLIELAVHLGVSGRNAARTVQRWETGERCPDILVIKEIEGVTHGAVNSGDFADLARGRASWRTAA